MPHSQKKLSKIASLQAYTRANEWYLSRHQNVPIYARLPVDSIYSKTQDRQYLSKWLEAFIVRFINDQKPEWKAVKVDNRGKAILNRQIGGRGDGRILGIMGYRKDGNQIIGEPDIRVLRPMQAPLYFEVKIGSDKLSQDQKDFIKAQWGETYVIKTLDEFFEVWDSLCIL
jgi:hypothetical protein